MSDGIAINPKPFVDAKNSEWRFFSNYNANFCDLCMGNIAYQLKGKKDTVNTSFANDCWKDIVVLDNDEECKRFIQLYQDMSGSKRGIIGKYGTGSKDRDTRIVIIYVRESERDEVLKEMKECASQINPNSEVYYRKGCEVYEKVFGPWKEWKEQTPVKHPENVATLLEDIGLQESEIIK